ncbi:Response regulator MprA [Lacunisphaera limnophila]|uniref:Response regulator MprA n=1 Tax=Lacunisphaera limnophila TaxID=1838286 RepID=A0A1I7PHZ9_9BACT|nr:response regulator transcription factor [Lacunisphaera limnophila]AOS43250.1 Response regulator MprA [Lacunisphaera limnophila]
MPVPSTTIAGAKLLLVEDSVELRVNCAELLRTAGYRVLEAADGVEALELWEREDPELILLDLNMPRLNGWQTLEKLKLRGCRRPVMLLTGLNEVTDRVRGLAAGADDYLGKPCDFRELIARVQALLRRSQPEASGRTRLQFGGITVDLTDRTAVSATGAVALTRTEYAILDLLARHHGRPVARATILDAVWGYTNRPNTRTVETHVWRLRQKLGDGGDEPQWIRTVPGSGYVLACEPETVAA